MKLRLFVDQPNIELQRGIQVTAETVEHYENAQVKQDIKNLVLETEITETGTNGQNSYQSESRIKVNLNAGDILLFDESRGFYLPYAPRVTIAQAIEDISSLASMKDKVTEV